MVPHRGTNWAALWLTAQIRRDAVLSKSYGRGYKIWLLTGFMGAFGSWAVVNEVLLINLP